MYFPTFWDVSKKSFLVIGGGSVALAKLETITDYTRDITVVSKAFSGATKRFTSKHRIKIILSEYKPKYLDYGDIIIAATNDKTVNVKIKNDCEKQGKVINVVDDKELSDFIFGAIVKKGDMNIAISTSGLSPVMARVIKEKIHRMIPEGFNLLNNFVRVHSARVKSKLTALQPRRLFWQNFLESAAADDIAEGNLVRGQNEFEVALERQENKTEAQVFFLGAGPGDPELITLKAVKYLSRADVVIYDRLVSPDILAYARRDALKINVGKQKDTHPVPQEKINKLIVEYAKKNNLVVRLKGGDATVFSHIAEEIEQVKIAGVEYRVVPGIGSVSGAAAYCSFPLTSRKEEKSLRILTYYKTENYDKAYWKNLVESKDFLAFYMSSHNASKIITELVSAGKPSGTPVAVIEQVTTPYQKTYLSDLANFKKKLGVRKFLSPSLLVIGNNLKWHSSFAWKEESRSGIYFSKVPKV